MTTAEDMIRVARAYLGVTEAPPGSNRQPFAPRAGHLNGYAWCSTFLVSCAREVGLKLPSESPYTPSMAQAFRMAGRWSSTPKRGAIGFVDFPGDNVTRVQHVALVLGQDIRGILTVEGNTSAGVYGSQDNGGGVWERVRSPRIFVGFGLPAYDEAPATLGQGVILPDREVDMAQVITRPQGGYIVVQHDGGVFAYEGAPYCGSIPEDPKIKLGGNIIGGAWTDAGTGYWLLASDGAVYGFKAPYWGGFNAEKPATRGARYAVGMVRTSPTSYRVVTFDPSGDASRFDAYDYRPHV